MQGNEPSRRGGLAGPTADAPVRDQGAALILGLGLLLVAAFAGLYARFVGLGSRPLAVDEYYFITSVRAIVATGVPGFEDGGFYLRGLLPQYITAASILLFGDHGLAYRLPAVLFNLGTVVAAYVLARRYLARPFALLLPALLLVSSWEVEFARFARMYAAFQLSTLLVWIVVDRVIQQERHAARWIPPAVLLAVLSHEQGGLFVPVLALPLVAAWLRREPVPGTLRDRLAYGVVSFAVMAVAAFLIGTEPRNLGVVDRFPPGFQPQIIPTLLRPELAVPALAVGALVAVGGLLLFRLTQTRKGARWSAAEGWAWAALAAAAVHSLPLFVMAGVLLLGRYGVGSSAGDVRARRVGAAAAVVMGAWVLILVLQTGPPSPELALFGWPNFFHYVVQAWWRELPVLSLILGAGLGAAILLNLRSPLLPVLRHPVALIVGAVLALGILNLIEFSTRHLFFVYPAALLTLLVVAARLAGDRTIVGMMAVVTLFAIGEDFNPAHLQDASGPEASLRIGRFEGLASTWYPRPDNRSPAEFVDRAVRSSPGRNVVVLIDLPGTSEFLDTPHAMFYARSNPRFYNVSREQGTVDLWSGERLVSTTEELASWLKGSDRVWIIARTAQELPAEVRAIPELAGAQPVYHSVDGRVVVLAATWSGSS